jgi:hypothetical protein
MKLNITKRDVKAFLFGAVVVLIIVLAYDWKDFRDGLTGAFNTQTGTTK